MGIKRERENGQVGTPVITTTIQVYVHVHVFWTIMTNFTQFKILLYRMIGERQKQKEIK